MTTTHPYTVVLVDSEGRRVFETRLVGFSGKGDDKAMRADAMRQARALLRSLHYRLESRD